MVQILWDMTLLRTSFKMAAILAAMLAAISLATASIQLKMKFYENVLKTEPFPCLRSAVTENYIA